MSNPLMISESGTARLTPLASEVTADSFVGENQLMLDGESAEYAVGALGKGQTLLILDEATGKYAEYRLVDIRLQVVS